MSSNSPIRLPVTCRHFVPIQTCVLVEGAQEQRPECEGFGALLPEHVSPCRSCCARK